MTGLLKSPGAFQVGEQERQPPFVHTSPRGSDFPDSRHAPQRGIRILAKSVSHCRNSELDRYTAATQVFP
jgi:hypothetical protein